MFSQKLCFLMNITNTSNSNLAHNIALDASHISRLKRGQRKLPKNDSFLIPMSEFFAHQIKEDYQKRALLATIKYQGDFPSYEKKVAEIIYMWLSEENYKKEPSVENIIDILSSTVSPKNASHAQTINQEPAYISNCIESNFYYGASGKRKAVIRFLTLAIEQEKPQTLFLFSDEELSWLYDDMNFVMQWKSLLKQVLMKGNHIKIIHTVNRNTNEMIEALIKWIPVYVSGAIDPYYYPKLRDGVFRRTLFIAPKIASVVSTSVQYNTDEMLNLFITDKEAIEALTKEYANYLSLCRPLMRIFNILSSEKYWDILSEMESAKATSIITGTVPSLMTMPPEVAYSISRRFKNNLYIDIHKKSVQSFEETVSKYEITEIISLPSVEQITSENVIVPLSEFINGKVTSYTKDEFSNHLKNTVNMLETYENYNVLLRKDQTENITLYGKEDIGVIMAKCDFPSVVFAMSEPNMTAAFWDYLLLIKEKAHTRKKKNVISELMKLIDQI